MHFWNKRQVNNQFISGEKKNFLQNRKLIEIIMVVRESYAS